MEKDLIPNKPKYVLDKSEGSRISPRGFLLIKKLLEHGSLTKAAKEVQMNTSVAERYLKNRKVQSWFHEQATYAAIIEGFTVQELIAWMIKAFRGSLAHVKKSQLHASVNLSKIFGIYRSEAAVTFQKFELVDGSEDNVPSVESNGHNDQVLPEPHPPS